MPQKNPEARSQRANRGRALWSGDRPENAYDSRGFQSASSPPVSWPADREWLSDGSWFADHPHRLFRARPAEGGVWLVRRRRQGGGAHVYLRVLAAGCELPADADGEIAFAWFSYANPDWPTERCRKSARRVLRRPRSAP